MKNFVKKLLVCVFLAVFVDPAVGLELDIEINVESSFGLNDTVNFSYTITSDYEQTITYEPHIDCPALPIPLIELETSNLQANISLEKSYNGPQINELAEPQACKAVVQILSPVQQIEGKEFFIDVPPSLEYLLQTCKDSTCKEKSKIFLKGETIYLNFETAEEGVSVSGTLTLPDETTKAVTLPTSIRATETGTYLLEAKTVKEGFKETKQTIQFGVIEAEAEIKDANVCNANGVCEKGETGQNCPQDCKEGEIGTVEKALPAEITEEKPSGTGINWWLIGGILVIILVIAGIAYFFYTKNK